MPSGIQVGDLLLIFAYRTTTTAPTLPSGWTSITTNSGDANSFRLGYRWAQGSDTSGTWTSATQLICQVYRGVAAVGVAASNDGTTSPGSIPGLTLSVPNGNSWVAGFIGSKQGTSQSTPATLTKRAELKNSTTSMVDGFDTNGGVSSFSAASVTLGTSTDWFGCSVELVASATTFAETADADFGIALWGAPFGGAPSAATDFVNGFHSHSTKYRPSNSDDLQTPTGSAAIGGTRFSCYIYLNALPTATAEIIGGATSAGSSTVGVQITSAGVLQLRQTGGTQIGSNGATLATGTWYRLTLCNSFTSTTINNSVLFVNGVSSISVKNATITNTANSFVIIGNVSSDATLDMRSSDHYLDTFSSMIDVASDVWVTAKRPLSNGTTNGFTTQIGSGGSGYGTGHAPQVNERPLSTTNGWSMVGAGSAVTEEYTIEGISVGDVDLSSATLLGYMGWIYASALASEDANIIVGGTSYSGVGLTSTNAVFTKGVNSTSYPSGNTDIGMITTTALTTVRLYEAGIVVAYTPGSAPVSGVSELTMLGVG